MKRTRLLTIATAVLVSTSAALAAGSGMPGDSGKPRGGDGIMPVASATPAPAPANATPQPKPARAPGIDLALKAIQAIAAGCRQYPFGAAVVNSVGEPILVYIPDGSRASHTYTAIRKAYSAVTYKVPTRQVIEKAQTDAEFAAKVKADPNLVAYGGGIPLMVGGEVIGAIGVSGAEPGAHDEECGMMGLDAIKGQLK
jgi:uncharacterized protein GlcG (DUF336 family)